MKIGAKVKIKDGSYMMAIVGNHISHTGSFKSTEIIGWCDELFTIVTIGGSYPAEKRHDGKVIPNNIIIRNDVNGEIWFCSFINIYKPVPQYTMKELRKMVGHDFEIAGYERG